VPQGSFSTSFTSPSECNAGVYSVLVSNFVSLVLSTNATLSFTNPAPAQPGHFDSVQLLADHSLLLNMSGTPYTTTPCSSRLIGPVGLRSQTLSGTNGLFQFDDPSPATNANRFYRLLLGP